MTSLPLKVSNMSTLNPKELQILDNIFRVAPNLVTIEIKNCPSKNTRLYRIIVKTDDFADRGLSY